MPNQTIWPGNAPMPSAPAGDKAVVVPNSNQSTITTVTFRRAPMSQPAPSLLLGQVPPGGRPKMTADGADIVIRTELPGVDLVFTRESEGQLFDTIRAENQARPGAQRVIFPEPGQVTREKYAARKFKQMVEPIEPSFVMHRRLYFEAINADRYGWEIGNLQPALSFGHFFYDVVALPYHHWTRPLQQWDSSAGKCLPGDNTPLQCYREPFSVTGLAAETGAVLLGVAVFP